MKRNKTTAFFHLIAHLCAKPGMASTSSEMRDPISASASGSFVRQFLSLTVTCGRQRFDDRSTDFLRERYDRQVRHDLFTLPGGARGHQRIHQSRPLDIRSTCLFYGKSERSKQREYIRPRRIYLRVADASRACMGRTSFAIRHRAIAISPSQEFSGYREVLQLWWPDTRIPMARGRSQAVIHAARVHRAQRGARAWSPQRACRAFSSRFIFRFPTASNGE